MSIVRTVDATMKNFSMNIHSKPVLLDHIKQVNVYSGLGIIGCGGDFTITYDMFKMIDATSQDFNPVGKTLDFTVEDNKTGTRKFDGVITSWRKIKNVKASLVIMTFERPEYVRLGKVRWWKCFSDKTIVEMFKEFLSAQGIQLNIHDTSLLKKRGTWWEYFAIPQNVPTLQFFLAELAKDNLLVYHNPENNGVNIASWYDVGGINELNKLNQVYVVEGHLAKFDESKDQWKESTFIFGKQIDSRSPWKIMEWQNSVAPNIWMEDNHHCWSYSGIKKALKFTKSNSKVKENDINLPTSTEGYNGDLISKDFRISPEPSYPALAKNNSIPAIDLGSWPAVTNSNIYPRYMFYRMRESYSMNIQWIKSNMMIAGSCKAVVPLTTVMVSHYENALNKNKDEMAPKDLWQSGLYIITECQLMITGNNIMMKYNIRKPFGQGEYVGESEPADEETIKPDIIYGIPGGEIDSGNAGDANDDGNDGNAGDAGDESG